MRKLRFGLISTAVYQAGKVHDLAEDLIGSFLLGGGWGRLESFCNMRLSVVTVKLGFESGGAESGGEGEG
jgi:hypothetical protein